MADADFAQDVELKQWEINNKSRPGQVRFASNEPGYGPEFCAVELCGVDMPVERREWGFKTCIDCRRLAEERKRNMR